MALPKASLGQPEPPQVHAPSATSQVAKRSTRRSSHVGVLAEQALRALRAPPPLPPGDARRARELAGDLATRTCDRRRLIFAPESSLPSESETTKKTSTLSRRTNRPRRSRTLTSGFVRERVRERLADEVRDGHVDAASARARPRRKVEQRSRVDLDVAEDLRVERSSHDASRDLPPRVDRAKFAPAAHRPSIMAPNRAWGKPPNDRISRVPRRVGRGDIIESDFGPRPLCDDERQRGGVRREARAVPTSPAAVDRPPRPPARRVPGRRWRT